MEAMKVRRKVRRKVWRETQKVRRYPYNREQAKNMYFFDLSVIFCEKTSKIAPKNGLNIDLSNLTLVNGWLK